MEFDWEHIAIYAGLGLIGYLIYLELNAPAQAAIAPGTNTAPLTNDPLQPGSLPMPAPATPDRDLDILARTIWGEARGEGTAGMEAVANVVMNRYHKGGFPGYFSIAGICTAPWQFSCWNANDPNRAKLSVVNSSDPQFAEALQIAQEAIAGQLADNTDGATYYHTKAIATPSAWGNVHQTADIGNQVFFAG